jgi:2-haloacid dehalogenase
MTDRHPLEAVAFDAMGTLFSLERPRAALLELGAPQAGLELWFGRILHEAATLTLVGDFAPFEELAAAALRTTLAQLGLDPARTEPLEALQELEPAADAAAALDLVRQAGLVAAVLTNGSIESTVQLLERGRLIVQEVVSVAPVQRYKPHAAPYDALVERVGTNPRRVALVAAHGWDCVGARRAGLRPVWVDGLERVWPFPEEEPERVSTLLEAARLLVRDAGESARAA